MIVSELIEMLQYIQEKHGDVIVNIEIDGTSDDLKNVDFDTEYKIIDLSK